jgi:hypothetical protein
MCYFNGGFAVLMGLAVQDLYKTYYNLEPGEVQSLAAYTSLPVTLKLLYGITSDSFPLFGSRRKSYIMILSTMHFVLTIWLAMLGPGTQISATVILTGMAFSSAFMDVKTQNLN